MMRMMYKSSQSGSTSKPTRSPSAATLLLRTCFPSILHVPQLNTATMQQLTRMIFAAPVSVGEDAVGLTVTAATRVLVGVRVVVLEAFAIRGEFVRTSMILLVSFRPKNLPN